VDGNIGLPDARADPDSWVRERPSVFARRAGACSGLEPESTKWTGYIPYDELPTLFNPPGGAIVTANNQVVPRHLSVLHFGRVGGSISRGAHLGTAERQGHAERGGLSCHSRQIPIRR